MHTSYSSSCSGSTGAGPRAHERHGLAEAQRRHTNNKSKTTTSTNRVDHEDEAFEHGRAHVLPVLLEKDAEKVEGQHRVDVNDAHRKGNRNHQLSPIVHHRLEHVEEHLVLQCNVEQVHRIHKRRRGQAQHAAQHVKHTVCKRRRGCHQARRPQQVQPLRCVGLHRGYEAVHVVPFRLRLLNCILARVWVVVHLREER